MRIGLHMHQIEVPLLHERLMEFLAVLPCSIAPAGHRSFIESKGMDDRLYRTAIG
jgi:hypothetical protein